MASGKSLELALIEPTQKMIALGVWPNRRARRDAYYHRQDLRKGRQYHPSRLDCAAFMLRGK